MTLVSMKLALMRVLAAQSRGGRQPAAEPAQPFEHFLGAGLAPDLQGAVVCDKVDPITFPEAQFAYEMRGEANSERITPSCDLHLRLSIGYTIKNVYHYQACGKFCLPPLTASAQAMCEAMVCGQEQGVLSPVWKSHAIFESQRRRRRPRSRR